ncbi:MAG: glycosyltransferase family 4 protein [Microbacterium sp.]|uniref:glycosyltransferase family 4 protein n=1 Tax=Microbacterium sp. TaxID=51671 RepID=UPI0039E48826
MSHPPEDRRTYKIILLRLLYRAARIFDLIGRGFGDIATLIRIGPRDYGVFARTHRLSRRRPGSTFPNGVTTALTPSRALGWHKAHWRHLVVVLVGEPTSDTAEWMRLAHGLLTCHFILAKPVTGLSAKIPTSAITYDDGLAASSADLGDLQLWMLTHKRRWDLVLLDLAHPMPSPTALVELQHAADQYHYDREIGIVVPAYRDGAGIVAGFDFDRRAARLAPVTDAVQDYGQIAIPRYVLAAAAHGVYVTSSALDRLDFRDPVVRGEGLDAQVASLVRRAWQVNTRTLCLSTTVLDVEKLPAPPHDPRLLHWQMTRATSASNRAPRIIFVLNATSVSGGIRIVFELANGLSERGFDVEIWSLEPHPTWFDLRVAVRRFYSYEDLLLALREVDAIKVATWWETAEIVWLASANRGIPVYLIQEFETWFYPDDPVGQAAVVASYRREFLALTEATYQREELIEIGVHAELIPNGYDSQTFRLLPDANRDEDTVLALGRSFFQKNFAMTLRAWRSLGRSRPKLLLFGTEPEIVDDERAEYHLRPRDAAVNELYNRATLFVQTSRHEGFCLPILEAMAAGCPVITTDSHGNRDFCVDGENCVIVPQDDDAALAAAIRRLLDDPAEQERLRVAGLATARRFEWPLVLDRVAEFYTQAVDRHAKN